MVQVSLIVAERVYGGEGHRPEPSPLQSRPISYLAGEAGFFILVDCRPFLDEASWEAEDALWRRILEEANVNLTPGSACRIGEPGFMRLCFAGTPPEAVDVAVRRIERVLFGNQ